MISFPYNIVFKKALELEGTYQVSKGVNMVRLTDVLHMYHDEDDEECVK